jgi:hypothetical protein
VFVPAVNQLAFQYQTSGPAPASQAVTISMNIGANTVFYPTVVTADGGSWLKVLPDVAATPGDLTATVDPTGLAAGLYYGLIGITDPAADSPTALIPVTLQVNVGPVLTVSGQALRFDASTGGTAEMSQQIAVRNPVQPTSFQAIAYGGDWLRVSPANGVTDGAVTVTVNPEGKPAGTYLGCVTVSIPGVKSSEQTTPVVLVVGP